MLGKLEDLLTFSRNLDAMELRPLRSLLCGSVLLVTLRVVAADPLDTRLGPLRGEQGDFLLKPAATMEQLRARASHVRRIMQVTMGLWPMPERTPLKAVIHGRRDLGDYSVEKVYFQSIPGFYVTGTLYRPKGKPDRLTAPTRRAAVLSPHGHFPGGRFLDEGLDEVQKKIEQGAEQYEDGGRSFMQSRCVQLARMGCIVFHYDMVGYADNEQIPLDVAHRFSRSRRPFDRPPESGFYSAAALLRNHNQLGLHTWNSVRALDFLTSLPDVDPNRIAVTGGSGGGTQTFMLCALDDRPLVSVPVVIVSADRQGGCTCENICGFRIDTHNLDMTALHAPKPMLLISADDATRTMSARGFPELVKQYRVHGAESRVKHVSLQQFPHNYNYESRRAMYAFLNRHLKLGLSEPIVEGPYTRLSREELTVWNEDHPRPETSVDYEQQLLETIHRASQRQLAALVPHDAKSFEAYQSVVGEAWNVLLRKLPEQPEVRLKQESVIAAREYSATNGTLTYRTIENHRAQLPMVTLTPKKKRVATRTVIWITPTGKAGLFDSAGSTRAGVRSLLAQGRRVIGVDLLSQGDSPVQRQRSLPGEEAFGGWTYCYNLPLFARRVHDILAVIRHVDVNNESSVIDIIGLEEAGPLVAAAIALSDRIDRAAIDTDGFRFSQLSDIYNRRFLPGSAKYGDIPGLLSLAKSKSLWLASETVSEQSVIHAGWSARGRREQLTIYEGEDAERTALQWLVLVE